MRIEYPVVRSENRSVEIAYRIAVGDLTGNIQPFKDGLLKEPKPVIMAGLDYVSPWTRDAAINSWFCGSMLFPEVSSNTLVSVLTESKGGKLRIAGEYWDAIIWAMGAWNHFLFSGDIKFLRRAFEAVGNSLEYFEQEEFDSETGLFRGGACFQDGIAGYPSYYADKECSSGIAGWVGRNPGKSAGKGFGLPMFSLSSNCLYYHAYICADRMAESLEIPSASRFLKKAGILKKAINEKFWSEEKGNYVYMLGPHGVCESQEGLGSSFAILFGIADKRQASAIMRTQHICKAGIPCVWPNFARYSKSGPDHFGRHCATVWPHVQGFWALAAKKCSGMKAFSHEFFALAEHACRDAQFTEIYHPENTEPYGGLQENGKDGIILWSSCRRQSWSASAFISMILRGIAGIEANEKGISFSPFIPENLGSISISGLRIRKTSLDLVLEASRRSGMKFWLNGKAFSSKSLEWERL